MGVEDTVPKQIGGVIPHFWFDILGRIVPGAFLLVGLFSEDWQQSLTSFVHKFAADFPLTSSSVGFFLLFSAASFFVGHFLGILSYYLIAWPVALFWPITEKSVQSPSELPIPEALKNCMQRFMSRTSETMESSSGEKPNGLTASARTRKHSKAYHLLAFWDNPRIRTHRMIAKQSEALAHWLWIRSPELAILVSRWSGDSLGGRSVALASGILLVSKWPCISQPIKAFLLILFFCGATTHYYYRNKSITGAFYFSTMFDPNPGGEQSRKG
jgi:hypothetical protein